jgi:hypothetical protein
MLDQILSERFLLPLLAVFFGIYGGKANPEIPQINAFFQMPAVRYAFYAAMVYAGKQDIQAAIFVPAVIAAVSYALKKTL